MATLQESIGLIGEVRKKNPGLDSLNDQELADLLYEQTGDERLRAAQQSSALARGIEWVGTKAGQAGQGVENAIAGETSSFPVKVAGRAVGNLVSSAPELGINVASAALRGIPRLLGFGTGAGFSYGRTKGETGSDSAALGSAAGSLLSLGGGIAGAQVGRKIAGPTAGKVGGFLGGATGSAVGSVPGDALEIATSPGGMAEFLADPVNLPAYIAGQTVVGAGMDLALEGGSKLVANKEKVRASIPELDSLISKTEAEELAHLRAKPVPEKTEIDLARERQLSKDLADKEELLVRMKTRGARPYDPASFETFPETPATLQAQAYLVHKGKKAVMEIPKGSDPNLDLMGMAAFREHTSPTNGNLYLYDETKANPELIENAIKTNSLGVLLGYGTPAKPASHNNTAAVLRNKNGVEKVAVILGDGNEQTVLKSLGDMALGTDKVAIEPLDQVIKWRQENSGLQKLYSLSSEPTDGRDEISFTNHILDMFGKAFESKTSGFRTKGPRFQVDQNAEISTKGLLQAVRDWAPAELWKHYEQAGIGTLLNFNKVKAADFTKWVRENTPEVEVKKLVPKEHTPEAKRSAEIQHEFESAGYEVRGSSIFDEVEQKRKEDLPPHLQPLMDELYQVRSKMFADLETNDAATGRYGVEPKPLEQMPGAVDILVRVPRGESKGTRFVHPKTGEVSEVPPFIYQGAGELYRGPHFGDSDVNVLASIRGYEETLPNGEKVFHVFELQSDWGQKASKKRQEAKDLGNLRSAPDPEGGGDWAVLNEDGSVHENRFKDKADADFYIKRSKNWHADHPLLASYETLGLKTAIQHARSIGAKYIAISDAETAMMTEGHDRNSRIEAGDYNFPELKNYPTNVGLIPTGRVRVDDHGSIEFELYSERKNEKFWRGDMSDVQPEWDGDADKKVNIIVNTGFRRYIEQEKGMRAAYDQRLPAIAQKLTRSKGTRVEFGQHKAVIENGDARPNRPDVPALRGSPVFNNKTNVTARLYDISNPSPEIRKLFSLYDADAQATFEHTLRLEKQKQGDGTLTPQQMLERAVAGQNIEVPALLKFLDSIKGVRGVLREGSFLDFNRLAEINLPTHDIKVSKDRTFAVNEAFRVLSHELSHGAVNDLRRQNPEAYKYLVDLVDEMGADARQSILTELRDTLKLGKKFDPAYLAGKRVAESQQKYSKDLQAFEFVAGLAEASAEHHLNSTAQPSWYKYLPQPVITVLQNFTRILKKFFGENFPGVGHMLDASQNHRLRSVVTLMDKHVSAQMSANLRALLNLQKTSVFDEANFVNQLPAFRQTLANSVQTLRGGEGELYSWAGDMFKKAVGKTQSKYEDYFYSALFRTRTSPETADHFWNLHNLRPTIQSEIYGYLANVGQTGELSRQQALERYGKFVTEVANPKSKRGQKWLDATSRILEENQNRRQAIMDKKQEVKQSDLVTHDEMKEKYGLTDEEADFVDRFSKIPELVIKEQLRKQEMTDGYRIAKMFYRANKAQDINGVVEKVNRLSRIANDAGAKLFEMTTYQKRLEYEARQAEPNLEVQGTLGAEVQRLQGELAAFRILFDQSIRQEFAGAIPMQPGSDSFINASIDVMTRMAAQRHQQRIITQDIGYAPMTRRGRFNLRVYETSELGDEFSRVKEYKGFDTKAEADKYIKDNKITDYELIDKEELKDRVRLLQPSKLQHIRDEAKRNLQELIAQYSSGKKEIDPNQRSNFLNLLSDVEKSFQPLEEEYKEVVAIKGDKFKERRYLVPGFDRNDFLPNIIEYMDYKTVAGNKQVTKARGELLLEDGRLDNQPELRKRMEDELNYTLSNQTEFNAARKAIFYWYLGGSIRHVIQNALQLPLNGVSQMMADGHGFKSYAHFSKAAKMAVQWNLTGSTGDKFMDSLLVQAEKDGVSVQHSIENPLHESVGLQNALDSINAQSQGSKLFGKNISYGASQLVKGFERFLQSTSTAAESANRKTAFIASVLAQRSKGVSDLRTQYGEASKFTNYVNFVGDKPNRPGYMIKVGGTYAHGIVSVMSALQSFVINHVSQLYSFGKKGFQQGSKNDRKAFYTGVATLLAFGGSMGMIGAATAEALFEEVTGISLKTALREGLVEWLDNDNAADRISDVVLAGLPALVGLDISNSVGLGSPLIRYQAGQPITAEQLMGPAGGILGRVKEGASALAADPFNPQQQWAAFKGSVGNAAFLSQLLRTFDVLSAGTVIDKNQQPVGDALGVIGSAAAVTGFTPMQVSKQRAFNSEVYKANKRSSEEYEREVRNVAQLLHDFNQTGDSDALVKANEQFTNYLNSVGGLQDRSAMVNSITTQLEEFEGRVTRPASLKMTPQRLKLERSFPSIESRAPTDVSSLLKSLEVALSLGQDDLLYQKLENLPASLLESILTDSLTQAGLSPAAAGLVQRPSSLERLGPNPDLQSLFPQ